VRWCWSFPSRARAEPPDAPPVIGSGIEQRGSDAVAPAFGSYEQIVQNQDRRHGAGAEARVELCEAGGRRIQECQEDDGLVVAESVQEKPARSPQIARLAVELAVGLEQRNDEIQVRDRGLANRNGVGRLIPVINCRGYGGAGSVDAPRGAAAMKDIRPALPACPVVH